MCSIKYQWTGEYCFFQPKGDHGVKIFKNLDDCNRAFENQQILFENGLSVDCWDLGETQIDGVFSPSFKTEMINETCYVRFCRLIGIDPDYNVWTHDDRDVYDSNETENVIVTYHSDRQLLLDGLKELRSGWADDHDGNWGWVGNQPFIIDTGCFLLN